MKERVDKLKNIPFAKLLPAVFILFIALLILSTRNNSDQILENEKPELVESQEAFTSIVQKLNEWSSDFKVLSCETQSTGSRGEGKGGKFYSYSCNVFSPKLSQTVLAVFSNNETSLSAPITFDEDQLSRLKNTYGFNKIDKIKTFSTVFDSIADEINFTENYYNIFIGERTISKFQNKYIWLVELKSRTERENGIDKVVERFYINTESGTIIR